MRRCAGRSTPTWWRCPPIWRGKGVAWAGAIPDEIQIVLPYSVAALTQSRAGEPARALLRFLATPDARRHFIASGVE
jgi:hypothetical protein